MNIKELQIGNWVAYYDSHSRICCIDARFNNVILDFDKTYCIDAPYIKPIAIAPAILLHNKITREERGEVLKHPTYPLEKWLIHTTFRDTWLWFNGYSQEWHLHDCNGQPLKYVHQLQNALQLNGINKDINL